MWNNNIQENFLLEPWIVNQTSDFVNIESIIKPSNSYDNKLNNIVFKGFIENTFLI